MPPLLCECVCVCVTEMPVGMDQNGKEKTEDQTETKKTKKKKTAHVHYYRAANSLSFFFFFIFSSFRRRSLSSSSSCVFFCVGVLLGRGSIHAFFHVGPGDPGQFCPVCPGGTTIIVVVNVSFLKKLSGTACTYFRYSWIGRIY